jgi:hypothetical protein
MSRLEKHRVKIREVKSTHYPPELVPFALCLSVLEVVLEENQEAKKLYDRIKEYSALPGCKETFDRLASQIPEGKPLIKAIVEKSGYDFNKTPEPENQMVYARGLLEGAKRHAFSYLRRNWVWMTFNIRRYRDLLRMTRCINNLIIVGFNNQSDLKKGKRKVTAKSSKKLVGVISFKAFADIYKVDIDDLGYLPFFQNGKQNYNVAAVMNGKMPARAKNELTHRCRKAGYSLKHDRKLKIWAWRWYQCRVVCSGPKEYYLRQLKKPSPEDIEIVEPENLSKEIKPYDEAIGYLRAKTGKPKTE